MADLGSARGAWSGNITGEFKIIRDPRDGLFRKYSEHNNPHVNVVRRSRVESNHIVNSTIERRDFRDDPEGRKWLDINPSTPVVKNGWLFSEGYIQG